MKTLETLIADVKILEPAVFEDNRGFFFESYNKQAFDAAIGRNVLFVQDNHSRSIKGTLRGLHFQQSHPQGKLVRCIQGEIFDLIVDIRRDSPTCGKWIGITLSAENKKMVWLPEGLAHGFLAMSGTAEVLYKTTDFYHPESERTLRWDDPTLAIPWPLSSPPLISDKDSRGLFFEQMV